MLDKNIINKMDADELRNYLCYLQSYTKTVKEINSIRKTYEDTLVCLLGHQKDLSILTLKENNQKDRLARLVNEMEDKYISACSSHVWDDDTI